MLSQVVTSAGGGISPLGDPTRRAIFEHLARHPSSVGELAERLPVTRQAVSQHLQVLKDAGLVMATAVGTKRIYRLDPHGIEALRSYVQTIWDHALTSFEKAAEPAAPHPPEE